MCILFVVPIVKELRHVLSHVRRYVPSQADVAVFEVLKAPPTTDLCHALRWYNHIGSYQDQKTR